MSKKTGPGNYRVEAGQPISEAFSATGWNRAQDAADIVLGVRPGVTAATIGGPRLSYTPVLVRNDGTASIEKGESMRIIGLVIEPEEDSDSVEVVVRGAEPFNNNAVDQPFVVAVEPIAQNAIGRAAIDGVVVAKINVTNSGHTGVLPQSNAPFLKSYESGPATILWKEHGTGSKWALLHLGRVSPVTMQVLTSVGLGNALTFNVANVQLQSIVSTTSTSIAVEGC